MHNGFIIQDKMKNNKKYDGNTSKFGITVDKVDYIVKTAKTEISSVFSEHVASRFIRGIGIACHETWLGWYNGELAVILKDFTSGTNFQLKSYKDTEQSSEGTDLSNKIYSYDDVLRMIGKHTKMSDLNKQKAIIRFWDMFICDAILGNRDRHHGNWGYIITDKGYIPAPIYDNGGSLFPDISKRIREYDNAVVNGKELMFIADRAEKFPASLFRLKRQDGTSRRTNYNEILSDLRMNKTMAREVKAVREKVGFNKVYETIIRIMIDAKEIIPADYRRFYVMIVCVRYLHLIERKDIKTSYRLTYRRLQNEVRNW